MICCLLVFFCCTFYSPLHTYHARQNCATLYRGKDTWKPRQGLSFWRVVEREMSLPQVSNLIVRLGKTRLEMILHRQMLHCCSWLPVWRSGFDLTILDRFPVEVSRFLFNLSVGEDLSTTRNCPHRHLYSVLDWQLPKPLHQFKNSQNGLPSPLYQSLCCLANTVLEILQTEW